MAPCCRSPQCGQLGTGKSLSFVRPHKTDSLLFTLTTAIIVGTVTNMSATELFRRRIPYSETAFAELVLWQSPAPLPGSAHSYKYRLAYVVNGVCVLRYDNESGKGDHKHFRGRETRYAFDTVDKLLASFQRDIQRINREDSDS